MDASTTLARRLLSTQDSALANRQNQGGFSFATAAAGQKEATGYTRVQLGDGSFAYAAVGSNAKLDEGAQVLLSGTTGVSRAANAGRGAL
jgi:hypothetical protein